MNLLRWLTGGHETTKPSSARSSRPEPLPTVAFAALVEKWRAIFRAEQQAQPSRAERERREAEREREVARRDVERLAQIIAYNGGAAFPGDEVGEPRPSQIEPNSLGGWWVRW